MDALHDFSSFKRVTSDCRPWPAGGALAVCSNCGTVLKPTDLKWTEETKNIYSGYSIYSQSNGVETAIFEMNAGAPSLRSEKIVDFLTEVHKLPTSGRLLDVGCGNGAFLRAFAKRASGWSLAGTELSETNKQQIENIPGVERLYCTPPSDVPGVFDVISLIHVIEHIPDPSDFLVSLYSKLNQSGALLVELPNHEENPFDLLIADHCNHFTPATLEYFFLRNGIKPLAVRSDWISKEITAFASGDRETATTELSSGASNAGGRIARSISWLKSVRSAAMDLSARNPIGFFGASIGASWLFGELDGAVSFFVDEDPNRFGKSHLGKKIYSPESVPAGSTVFIPLPEKIAARIRERLGDGSVEYVTPPAF